MGKKIDIMITKDGMPVALVEVKNRKQFSLEQAKSLRTNLLKNLYPPVSFYLLLVSQDYGYLWTNKSEEPSYHFPMNDVIDRYYNRNPEKRLRNSELEFIIYQWLIGLTYKPKNEKYTKEPEKSLHESGLIEIMHSAHVTMEDEI